MSEAAPQKVTQNWSLGSQVAVDIFGTWKFDDIDLFRISEFLVYQFIWIFLCITNMKVLSFWSFCLSKDSSEKNKHFSLFLVTLISKFTFTAKYMVKVNKEDSGLLIWCFY